MNLLIRIAFVGVMSFFSTMILNAQSHYDYWPIGTDILVKFESGVPVFKDSIQFPFFGNDRSYTSYSDSNGKLVLFGNETHILSANGDTLHLLPDGFYNGALGLNQSSLLLTDKMPQNETKNDRLYYLYIQMTSGIVPEFLYLNIAYLRYLQNETSYIVELDSINTLIENGSGSEVQAIRHANGRDWWIIARILPNPLEFSNQFWIALLSSDGVSTVSTQDIGSKSNNFITGEFTFSPDGSQLALASGTEVQLFDFDRCTGQLSNHRMVEDSVLKHYGCAFSPDGTKLYVSTGAPKLLQYDLNTPDYTRTEIFSSVGAGQSLFYEGTQLEQGPDGKIYWGLKKYAFGTYPYGPDPSQYLMAITNPDAPGPEVALDTFAVWLGGFYNRSACLPNFANYELGALEGSECDTLGGGNTAIPDASILPEWNVYPTLSGGTYRFEGPTDTWLVVYDAMGRISWQGYSDSGSLNLTELPNGVYTIAAQRQAARKIFRVVKQ